MRLLHSQLRFGDDSGDIYVVVLACNGTHVWYDYFGSMTRIDYNEKKHNSIPICYFNDSMFVGGPGHMMCLETNVYINAKYQIKVNSGIYFYDVKSNSIVDKGDYVKTTVSINLDYIDMMDKEF